MSVLQKTYHRLGQLFGLLGSGSGMETVSTNRRNAIKVNVSNASQIYDVYAKYPIIFGIVDDIVSSISNTPIWFSNENGSQLNNRNTATFKRMLLRPNRKTRNKNFLSAISFELAIFSRCFIRRATYFNGDDEYFVVKNTDINNVFYDMYDNITKIWVNDGGKIVEYSDVFELVYSHEETRSSNKWSADDYVCPIVSLRLTLESYANMLDALNGSYSDGGARKIINFKNSDGSYSYAQEMLPKEVADVKEQLRQDYGRNTNDNKYIISKGDVSVNDLSLPTNQLDVPNTKTGLEDSICYPFKYPPQRLGAKSGAYKSSTEAERAFYTNCVSPMANFIFQQLDDVFGTKIIDRGGKIELDYSGYIFFQEGKTKKGSAIQTFAQGIGTLLENGLLTREQAIVELNDIL